jgi:dihydroneopterin aldolase
MDKIKIEQAVFYGYHGVYDEERKLGQKFIVDMEILGDFQEAAEEDNLEKTVNYVEVFQVTKKIVERKKFRLLEALALHVCEAVLNRFKNIQTAKVRIQKPNVSISGVLSGVTVELTRSRQK